MLVLKLMRKFRLSTTDQDEQHQKLYRGSRKRCETLACRLHKGLDSRRISLLDKFSMWQHGLASSQHHDLASLTVPDV